MFSQKTINEATRKFNRTASRAKLLRSAPKTSPVRQEAIKRADEALMALLNVEPAPSAWLHEANAKERGEDYNTFAARRLDYV